MTASTGHPASNIEELSREECLRLLRATSFGRLAVSLADRAPLIRPVNYLFDEPSQSVVFRTAAGSKFGALVRARRASFEIDGIDHGERSGWSVIIAGATEEVVSRAEIDRLDAHGLESWAAGANHFWIRIRAFTVSGRRILPASETQS